MPKTLYMVLPFGSGFGFSAFMLKGLATFFLFLKDIHSDLFEGSVSG